MTDTATWIVQGNRVAVTAFGGAQGTVFHVYVDQISVRLDAGGEWCGPTSMVTAIVPVEPSRHPAVTAALDVVETTGIVGMVLMTVDAMAKCAVAVLRWADDHIDDRDGYTLPDSWLREQADAIEASVNA